MRQCSGTDFLSNNPCIYMYAHIIYIRHRQNQIQGYETRMPDILNLIYNDIMYIPCREQNQATRLHMTPLHVQTCVALNPS